MKGLSISSNMRRSWMTLETACILMHLALLMYLRAYKFWHGGVSRETSGCAGERVVREGAHLGLLVLDNADLAKGAAANGTEEVEVVEVDRPIVVDGIGLAARDAHGSSDGWETSARQTGGV